MPVRIVEKVKGTEKQVEREQDGKDAKVEKRARWSDR